MEKEIAALQDQVKKLEEQTKKQEKTNKQIEKEKESQVKAKMKAANNIKLESFKVSYKLNLIPDEAAYMLIVDSKLAISQVLMQSKQNVDILMIKDNLASINRIDNIADPNIQSMASLFIEQTGGQGAKSHLNRLEVKIRTSEGQQGNI